MVDVDIMIGFKSEPKKEDIDMVLRLGGQIKRTFTIIKAVSATVPKSAIENIKKNSNVEYVEIDEKVFAHIPIGICQELKILKQAVPWGIGRIGSRLVNAMGNTGKGVKIAVLDTGIDAYHEDLKTNYKGGFNFINEEKSPIDDNGHGTHVAGIIAAEDNDEGVVGVAPDADLYSVKVLDFSSCGSISSIVAGLEWSIDHNMHIINMSLGSDTDSLSVRRSCDIVYAKGILLVAAAGNSGNVRGTGDSVDYPARYDSVISVGATDINDKRGSFSSTGPNLEIAAPGVNIESTLPGNKYGVMSGTSMASPHVAGVAALIMAREYGMTNTEVRMRLQITTQNITKDTFEGKRDWYGYGLVDAVKAVSI